MLSPHLTLLKVLGKNDHFELPLSQTSSTFPVFPDLEVENNKTSKLLSLIDR